MRKRVFRVFDKVYNMNQAVQTQKRFRSLKLRALEVKGFYCLCSENKDADQLRSHRAADLHLCSSICKNEVFL